MFVIQVELRGISFQTSHHNSCAFVVGPTPRRGGRNLDVEAGFAFCVHVLLCPCHLFVPDELSMIALVPRDSDRIYSNTAGALMLRRAIISYKYAALYSTATVLTL